jgi:hypothetical protein
MLVIEGSKRLQTYLACRPDKCRFGSASGLVTKNSWVGAFRGVRARARPVLGLASFTRYYLSIPFLRFDRYPTANNPIAVLTGTSNQEIWTDVQIAHFSWYINLLSGEYPAPKEIPLNHQISLKYDRFFD